MELQMSIGVSLAKQMSMQKRVFSNLLGGGVEVQARLSSLFEVDMFQGKVVTAEYVSQICTKNLLQNKDTNFNDAYLV